MHNNRILIIVGLLVTLSIFVSNAQQAVLTSGQDVNGVGGSVAYSVGQMDYTHFRSDSGSISLGVQQPLVMIIIGTNDPQNQFEVNVFPNPVSNTTNLKLQSSTLPVGNKNLLFRLHDINGKQLIQKEITSETTLISMEGYSSGIYLLSVVQKNAEIKTFKIFKTN
ncbi:MAG TPA: T9SS type A sorting domain-containing protein [Saprospiraceae bacterium]|nr:T9SS type A sorting domain-containing protein [Saprospiraceae bacterium]